MAHPDIGGALLIDDQSLNATDLGADNLYKCLLMSSPWIRECMISVYKIIQPKLDSLGEYVFCVIVT